MRSGPPIVHVNADDPEACLSAVQLAIDFHMEFAQYSEVPKQLQEKIIAAASTDEEEEDEKEDDTSEPETKELDLSHITLSMRNLVFENGLTNQIYIVIRLFHNRIFEH